MAKVSVRRCDRCSAFDAQDLPVRRLHIICARFDICMNCAIVIIDDSLHDALRSTEMVTTLFGVPVMDPDQLEMIYSDASDYEGVYQDSRELAAAEAHDGR